MTLSTPTSLALLVARRQKRAKYWEERFSNGGKDEDALVDIEERLQTYRLLISKLVRATSEAEIHEAETRLAAMDAQLASLFEARRLMTSPIGVPAVGDK